MRWALKYGARWRQVLICVNRGYHFWNTTAEIDGEMKPVPPTICCTCHAEYTEAWHREKYGLTQESA